MFPINNINNFPFFKMISTLILFLLFHNCWAVQFKLPIVVNTWAFVDANTEAFQVLQHGGSVLDAVERGCVTCEQDQCDGTVGYGGSPDETGETTLDAMIMDGLTMRAGAVAALRNIKPAVSVARKVMEHTRHTLLVGSQASKFALQMGFRSESLSTNASTEAWQKWENNNCQPNYWINVSPDPSTSCGPYTPTKVNYPRSFFQKRMIPKYEGRWHHDTIGIIAIDRHRRSAVATSTNGAIHKIPGRVGDSPIIGAGGYVCPTIGAAAATGDGDVLMRYLPSFRAVETMRMGLPPRDAAISAIASILEHEQDFQGAVIVVRIDGEFAAACYGMNVFPFTVSQGNETTPRVYKAPCLKPHRMVYNRQRRG